MDIRDSEVGVLINGREDVPQTETDSFNISADLPHILQNDAVLSPKNENINSVLIKE